TVATDTRDHTLHQGLLPSAVFRFGERTRQESGNCTMCSSTRHKESDMVTLFASTAPCRIELQEVIGHIATLEQVTRAVHEGYLGPPLYHQAAHTAQRLLALVEAMAWDEGTCIAHEIACLFQT